MQIKKVVPFENDSHSQKVVPFENESHSQKADKITVTFCYKIQLAKSVTFIYNGGYQRMIQQRQGKKPKCKKPGRGLQNG